MIRWSLILWSIVSLFCLTEVARADWLLNAGYQAGEWNGHRYNRHLMNPDEWTVSLAPSGTNTTGVQVDQLTITLGNYKKLKFTAGTFLLLTSGVTATESISNNGKTLTLSNIQGFNSNTGLLQFDLNVMARNKVVKRVLINLGRHRWEQHID